MFGSDDLKMTVFKNGKLQLLLKLIGAERIGERGMKLDRCCLLLRRPRIHMGIPSGVSRPRT
jgi:hypothetical protein